MHLRKCMLCNAESSDPNVVLKRFPKPGVYNLTRCEKWAKFCFPDKPYTIKFSDKLYSEHRMLCTKHFPRCSFSNYENKIMFRDAVPTLLNGEDSSANISLDLKNDSAEKYEMADQKYVNELSNKNNLANTKVLITKNMLVADDDDADKEYLIEEAITIDDDSSTNAIIESDVTETTQLLKIQNLDMQHTCQPVSSASDTMYLPDEDVPGYDELCRACLSREHTKPMPEELFDMFLDVTGLLSEDCIPKVMCDVCERRLKDSSEFRNQCLQHNQWLIDKIQIKSKDSNNRIAVNNSIENDNIAACIDNTDNVTVNIETGTVNTEIGLMNTENESSMKIKTRPLNLQRRKKIYVQVLDRCTNKLKPAPGHVVPHVIKEFMEKMKYRPLNFNLKPSIKESNLIPRTISQREKAKKRLNSEEEEYYSDESDSNCYKITDNKRKKGNHNTEASPIDKQVETIEKIDKNNEMKSSDKSENIEEQKENEQSYNLHRDLVFDHKVLENTPLLLSTFFIRRKLSLEEQKNQILKIKTSASYLRRTYKCDLCYHGFMNKTSYDTHMIKHTSSAGNFTCDICYINFHKKKNLLKHISDLHRFFYQCKYCTKSFYNKKKATTHIQEMHSTKLFKCDKCDYKVKKKATTHIQEMHSTKLFKCDKCDYKVKALRNLSAHKRLQHPCKYFCKFCGYSFVSANGLNAHLAIKHKFIEQQPTTEEIYCYTCDITFMNKEAYETHKRVSFQHGELVAPNMKAKKYLPKNFIARKDTKKIMCEWCGFELTRSIAYRAHLLRAHPEKYEFDTTGTECALCEICGKNIRHGYLLTHCKNVHNFIPKTIECEVCHMRFRWRKNRNKHFKARHYEEYLAKNKKRNEQKRMININDDDDSD